MTGSTEFITDAELYERVIGPVAKARKFVWIGTADIKDLHVKTARGSRSFLAILDAIVAKGVAIRLAHAKEPGPRFRASFDKYPRLWEQMERVLCPRIHFKHVIIDGTFAYSGSANLTGAGLGMKSPNRRNFESGFITTDRQFVQAIMNQFDRVWMGAHCEKCGHRKICPDPIV
ncbi:MAG: phospholipase [Leptonema illini]|uniref:Phospholipase n=1 Tax=Leptonema illini TaxID=183 RepID=A0A833LYK2_9LEPT|nr:MAG: phospholipase [Leptonema illini]